MCFKAYPLGAAGPYVYPAGVQKKQDGPINKIVKR